MQDYNHSHFWIVQQWYTITQLHFCLIINKVYFGLLHGQNLTEKDFIGLIITKLFQSGLFRGKMPHITVMYNIFIH